MNLSTLRPAICTGNAKVYAILAVLTLLLFPARSFADKLHHVDGTIIDGKISKVTETEITIVTRYGTFSYHKADIKRIDRDAPPPDPNRTPEPTPGIDKSRAIPAGPVNPFAPPVVPPLFAIENPTPIPGSELPAPPPGAGSHAGATQVAAAGGALASGTVSGQVQIFHNGVAEPASASIVVQSGDSLVVRTGKVRLAFQGGASAKLGANSSAIVMQDTSQPANPVQVRVNQGAAWAERPAGASGVQLVVGDVIAQPDPAHSKSAVFKAALAPTGEIKITVASGSVVCMKSGAKISISDSQTVSVPPAGVQFSSPQPAAASELQEWKQL